MILANNGEKPLDTHVKLRSVVTKTIDAEDAAAGLLAGRLLFLDAMLLSNAPSASEDTRNWYE